MKHQSINIKISKPNYNLELRPIEAKDLVLSFRAMRNTITSTIRFDKMDVSGLVLGAGMTQILHSRPLSLDLLQSNSAKATLVPAFINKIFRALFEYRSSNSITYSCSFENINNFEDILQYIKRSKREVSGIEFSEGLAKLGHNEVEIQNITRGTESVLDRFASSAHPSVLIADITGELAKLADGRYRDAETVRREPIWRAIEPASRIESVRPLSSRGLWREGECVCAQHESTFLAIMTYHLLVNKTSFVLLGKTRVVETVSPNAVVYELDSIETYEYGFAYLNALLDLSDTPSPTDQDESRRATKGRKPKDTWHLPSEASNSAPKGGRLDEAKKTVKMVGRMLKDGVNIWTLRVGEHLFGFLTRRELEAFFAEGSG